MNGKLLLIGMIQYFVFAVVLFRKFGRYLQSQKPGSDRERPILRWWETVILPMSLAVWIILMFPLFMAFARETVVNALTGVLIALGLTAVTPILAPPFVYTGVMFLLLRENHRRKRALKEAEEQAGKNPEQ